MDFLPRVIRIILKRLPHPVQRNATKAEYYFGGKIQRSVTLPQVQHSVFPAGEPGVLQSIRKRGVFAYLGNKPEQPPVADGLIAKRHKNGKGFSIGLPSAESSQFSNLLPFLLAIKRVRPWTVKNSISTLSGTAMATLPPFPSSVKNLSSMEKSSLKWIYLMSYFAASTTFPSMVGAPSEFPSHKRTFVVVLTQIF